MGEPLLERTVSQSGRCVRLACSGIEVKTKSPKPFHTVCLALSDAKRGIAMIDRLSFLIEPERRLGHRAVVGEPKMAFVRKDEEAFVSRRRQDEVEERGEGVEGHASDKVLIPEERACATMFAVPRPPGNATQQSGLPSTSICLFRVWPAALPCVFQSAG